MGDHKKTERDAKLAGIPESTRRVMERMVNTPPQPRTPKQAPAGEKRARGRPKKEK